MDQFIIDRTYEQNRRLVSKGEFGKQEQIMVNDPLEIIPLQSQKNFVCFYCLTISQKALSKCSQCNQVYYCSANCQKNDWSIHKLECKVIKQFNTKKIQLNDVAAMALRSYFKSQSNENFKKQFNDLQFQINKLQPDTLRQFKNLSYAMIKFLDLNTDPLQKEKFLHIFLKIHVNSFENNYAFGLYTPQNFLNHSCDPNCEIFFIKKKMYLVSLRKIKQSEELSIFYQEKQFKNFDCYCQNCDKDQKQIFDENLMKKEYQNYESISQYLQMKQILYQPKYLMNQDEKQQLIEKYKTLYDQQQNKYQSVEYASILNQSQNEDDKAESLKLVKQILENDQLQDFIILRTKEFFDEQEKIQQLLKRDQQ